MSQIKNVLCYLAGPERRQKEPLSPYLLHFSSYQKLYNEEIHKW